MTGRTRIFVLIAAALGIVHFTTAALAWRGLNPELFLFYLGMAIICGFVRVPNLADGRAFSLNLPFILLSMVQLSLTEAVIVGGSAMLAQSLCDPHTRSKPSQIAVALGVLATVIATANFTYHSVIPRSLQNETLRLLIASVALFFANTFPAAIVQRLRDTKRIGRIWKESYFWSFPYYLVAAALAKALLSVSRGISMESALLVLPAL